MLESSYEQCLMRELGLQEIECRQQVILPVEYKRVQIDCGYRIDILVEDRLILEIKAVQSIVGIHEAQLLTYMKLAEIPTGLLINFNVQLLKNGITRFKR